MKSRKYGTKETRVAHWRAHVHAWRESGLSQVGYCRDHGISQSSLRYWIRGLDIAPPIVALPSIVEIAPAAVVQALQPEHTAPFTLTIAGRYQLDIRDDFRTQVLEKIVRTLERL